jgi:hypothetical protein
MPVLVFNDPGDSEQEIANYEEVYFYPFGPFPTEK